MVSVTIISLLALMGGGLYFWKRTAPGASGGHDFKPRTFRGLFDEPQSPRSFEAHEVDDSESFREELLARARLGQIETLAEAHSSGDALLYSRTLGALLDSVAGRHEELLRLVSHISKSNGLRGNGRLAGELLSVWKTAPDRRSTTEMIHIAALSDDAGIYNDAVESVISFWREDRLSMFRAEELAELLESQYWLLAPEARRGGAGFALKHRVSGVRRELATTTTAR